MRPRQMDLTQFAFRDSQLIENSFAPEKFISLHKSKIETINTKRIITCKLSNNECKNEEKKRKKKYPR